MATAIARHAGARFIAVSDVSPERLELARRAGADHVVDARSSSLGDAVTALGMAEGFATPGTR